MPDITVSLTDTENKCLEYAAASPRLGRQCVNQSS